MLYWSSCSAARSCSCLSFASSPVSSLRRSFVMHTYSRNRSSTWSSPWEASASSCCQAASDGIVLDAPDFLFLNGQALRPFLKFLLQLGDALPETISFSAAFLV